MCVRLYMCISIITEAKLGKIPEIEARQQYLEGENSYLKQMLYQSRNKQVLMLNKMEHVLKLLYSAYISAGGSLGGML